MLTFKLIFLSSFYPAPLPCLDDVTNDQVLSMSYKDPQYPEGHIFTSKLLPGAK